MSLTRPQLCRLIPHTGAMCLLDEVVEWGEGYILCRTRSHKDPANPLCRGTGLPTLAGIEYAAQAMAIHGGLLGPPGRSKPALGFLGGIRGVKLAAARLDTLNGDLEIRAERLIGDETSVLYQFQVYGDGAEMLSGRASVFFVEPGVGP